MSEIIKEGTSQKTTVSRIGIVYICTGKYHIFWNEFYRTSQEYLLVKYEKHYFVFTDSDLIRQNRDVTVIHRKPGGFPMDSLLRFEMFTSIEKDLLLYDYVFFFNSNMCFVDTVDEEIFPVNYDSGLTGLIHPGYYNKHPFWFPYERNPKSKAAIKRGNKRYRYFMGSLLGGKTKSFLDMCEECVVKIREDLENEIIAVYHDESHLNRYFLDREILELDPG
ncbi:MAG: globoside alpha-1,3-N-acetylgalactosaminyltransferase 1, partial [Bacteroidales bacterium]|nr:globoside alpha-1,3-N-acetylgalactosaminyltransferase 1 [Bacteroidales bacterium]